MTRKKLGIVLGGGGGRAFAHIGVLLALEEAGLKPDMVSGASMGAVLGAVYAACPEAERILPEVSAYFRSSSAFGKGKSQPTGDGLHRRPGFAGRLKKKLATFTVAAVVSFRKGLLKQHPLNRTIDDLFADKPANIEDLKLPFVCTALELGDGRLASFTSGQLMPALKAGVAVGMIFSPFQLDGKQYIDAVPVCAAPVSACRDLGAEVTLAVDLSAPLDQEPHLDTGFDVVRRLLAIESDLLNAKELKQADFVVKPRLDDIFWGDFSKIDQAIERGREAALPHLPALKAALEAVS